MRHSVSIETKKRELRLEGDIKPFTSLSWDLKGKLCPAVLTKNQWILIFTCTAGSDFIVHYTLKKKSEAWTKVEPLLRLIYKKGWCVKTMHSDFDSLWSSSINTQEIDLIEKAQGCRSYPVTNIENELGPVEHENLLILGERAMSAYSCDTYTRAMPTRTATRTARRNRPEHHKRPYLATVCGRDRLVQHLVPHRATTSHLV